MAYRYTGYAVSGVDVLIWILLTAGSIGFPVIVLAICCVKLHIRNNEKTKHLTHLLDGDVFDRKSKSAGFNRYFFNQHSVNETSVDNSTTGSPKKPPTAYSGGERVLSQLGKPLSVNKNSYTYSTENLAANSMPIIINRDIVNRDIYAVSDSYENTADVNYSKINMGFDTQAVETVTTDAGLANSSGDNFENLYSQVTKKPSTRNSSVRHDQALYMNTFYSS